MMHLTQRSSATRRLSATIAILAATTMVALAGCSATPAPEPEGTTAEVIEPTFTTAKEGVLTVAPYGSSPPAIIVNPDKSLGGLIGELFTGFATKYGLKIELFETTFTSALLATQQGRADVTPFIYHNPERATTVYYTSSIFQLPAAVMTRDDFDYKGPKSLNGVKVAAVVGQVWAPYMTAALGDNALLFQSAEEAAQALLNGQVDAYVNSALQLYNAPLAGHDDIVAHLIDVGDFDMPATVITNIGYSVVSCDNPELAKAMDAYVEELRASGEWEALNDELGFDETFRLSESTTPEQGC